MPVRVAREKCELDIGLKGGVVTVETNEKRRVVGSKMAAANLIVMVDCYLKAVESRQKNYKSQMLQTSHKHQMLPKLEMPLALSEHRNHRMSQNLAKDHRPFDYCAVFFHRAWSLHVLFLFLRKSESGLASL